MKLVKTVSNGTLTLNTADGSFSYVHDGSETTGDSFTYRANDGTGDSNVAIVSISVTPQNDPPVASGDAYTVPEGGTLVVNGVLDNDTDADGDKLTAVLVTDVQHGTLVLDSGDGSFKYIHDGGETTGDSFTYKATDGTGVSNVATVTITVTPENDLPVASGDSYTVLEGGTLTADAATGVLANDTDAENNTLTAKLVTTTNNGTLFLNSNGSFTYVHDGSETTTDSFTYKATDGTGDSNVVTVSITVTPVNDLPVAAGDAYTVVKGGTVTADAASGVLANDTDAEGDSLTVVLVDNVSHGTLVLNNADGSFTYTHDNSAFTGDSFTYKANDSTGDSNVATVTISISANAPPVAQNDAYTVLEGGTLNAEAASGVLDNDSDPTNDPLTAALVRGVDHGILTLNTADGAFTYVHDGGETVNDSFTYRANDGTSNSNVATVSVSITPVNDVPVARDDAYVIQPNGKVLPGTFQGVLANDTDAEGNTLTAVVVTPPKHGQPEVPLTLNPDGSFEYTHDPLSNTSTDSFTYKANDGTGDSNVAEVILYRIDPFNLQAILGAGDPHVPSNFGYSVAIDGDRAVVGRRGPGNVYIFERSGKNWVQVAKLSAADAVGNNFGKSVAISGDTVVVGAFGDDDNGRDAGAVYVFVRSGNQWIQQAKLTAASAGAWMGFSVAIDGETIVAGAHFDAEKGVGAGAAYVFVRSGVSWSQQAKLTASDTSTFHSFGFSVNIDGDTVIAGARGVANSTGAAYIFTRAGTTWTEHQKLLAGDPRQGARFGSAVDVRGDTAVVGSIEGGVATWAYVFKRGSDWTQRQKLRGGRVGPEGQFGRFVAVTDDPTPAQLWSTCGVQVPTFSSRGSLPLTVRRTTSWATPLP